MNAEPREGIGYVLVNLSAENTTDQLVYLGNDDFALVGASGNVRRFLGVTPPDPALEGAIEPGETVDGWLVFSAPADETGLIVMFDPLALDGDWADRYLALGPDVLPPPVPAPQPVNDTGRDPLAPVDLGAPVITGEWQLELQEIATGAAVFDLVDYRTGALKIDDALGESDGSVWLALRFRITSNAVDDLPATFPANAFALTDAAGTPILDLATLTPPRPDAAGEFFPGATRDGWVAFDVPFDAQPVLVRFLPYPESTADPDPRYFTAQG
jgi:hypothetical protein